MAIPITRCCFGEDELRAVQLPLESGWVVQGPFVKEFEDRFATFTGAANAVATTSCTTALHATLAALGLKPGDEVIVPAFTWIATPNVVEYMGAKPVFCDIKLETFNIDPGQIESLVSPRTVGILPVHLFGLCADMDAILAVARKNNLWVVEDAACAFGSWIGDRHAGTFGNAGCFSFHPRKSITTGEGGMITTGDAELASLSRTLRDHGASRSDLARHHTKAAFLLAEYNHLGYNYRMTDIQGALGCAQMRRAGTILHERAKRAEMYDERLRGIEQLQTPMTPAGFRHGYQSYVCLYRPKLPTLENVVSLYERRNEIMTRLETQGIATRQGTHAPVLLGYYAEKYELSPSHFPNSYFADRLSLALPLFPQLTEQELDLICLKLQEALNGSPSA